MRSQVQYNSHQQQQSQVQYNSHHQQQSQVQYNSHQQQQSQVQYNSHHQQQQSQVQYNSHQQQQSQVQYNSHQQQQSQVQYNSHQQQQSQARGGYQFGDITKNIVSKGKESDGRSKNDGYKFGKCSWIDHFVPTFSFLMLLCKLSFYQAISLVVSSNRLRTGRRDHM